MPRAFDRSVAVSAILAAVALLLFSASTYRNQAAQPRRELVGTTDVRSSDDHLVFVCEETRFQVAFSDGPTGQFVQRIEAGTKVSQIAGERLQGVQRLDGRLEATAGGKRLHIEKVRKLGFHEHLSWGRLSCWR